MEPSVPWTSPTHCPPPDMLHPTCNEVVAPFLWRINTALVLMRHKNGATTSLQVGWSISGGGQWVGEVHGTEGSISQTRPEVKGIAYYNNKKAKWIPLQTIKPKLSPYGALFAEFAKAFSAGKSYGDSHAAAWNNMAILEAAYRS